jgi:hypothetical protein
MAAGRAAWVPPFLPVSSRTLIINV